MKREKPCFFTELEKEQKRGLNLVERIIFAQMKRLLASLFFILAFSTLRAQVNVRDSLVSSWMISIKLSGNLAAADLADRYGNAFGLGLEVSKKTRTNWLFGVDGTYFFGQEVKNLYPIFKDLITEQGNFIGLNGELAGVEFFSRGYYTGGHVGKIFPIIGPNPNSGLLVKLGAGYMQNWIYMRMPNVQVPQIQGEYQKGYDRMHGGFALRQQINYMHSSSKRTVNFIIGFEFIEGFTHSLRQFNYDTNLPDLDQKLDAYLGLHFTWFLPVYAKNEQKFFYE